MLGLSYELEGSWLSAEKAPVIAGALGRLVPADSTGALEGDGATRQLAGWSDTPVLLSDEVLGPLLDTFFEHPMLTAFLSNRTSAAPRRLSDSVPERRWLEHRVYRELFVPMGAKYQLAIPLHPMTGTDWAGWVLNRGDRDFSDADMEVATALQPLLAAFDQLASSHAQAAEATDSPLTVRETAVLRLLGEALTATQIGFVLRISPRTVRKHIEHIYEKLDCHDRVRAVRVAQRLGLLGEERDTPRQAAVPSDSVDVGHGYVHSRIAGRWADA